MMNTLSLICMCVPKKKQDLPTEKEAGPESWCVGRNRTIRAKPHQYYVDSQCRL